MSQHPRSSFFRASLAAALLGIGLVATLPVLARGEGGRAQHGERGFGRFLPPPGYLDLSEEQREAAEAIRDQTKAALEPLMASQREVRAQLREAVDSATPDTAAIGELVLQIRANREQFKKTLLKAEADFVALLNADQKEKYENFRELREQRRERRHERLEGLSGGDEI